MTTNTRLFGVVSSNLVILNPRRARDCFFDVPIETSISPIKSEMLALHRLTGRRLNEFHGRLLKVDSSSRRRDRSYTPVYTYPVAYVWQATVCNYPAGRARIREADVQAIMSHFGPDITFQFDIADARAADAHHHFDALCRISNFFFPQDAN